MNTNDKDDFKYQDHSTYFGFVVECECELEKPHLFCSGTPAFLFIFPPQCSDYHLLRRVHQGCRHFHGDLNRFGLSFDLGQNLGRSCSEEKVDDYLG